MKKLIYILLLFLFISSCSESNKSQTRDEKETEWKLKYAEKFKIFETSKYFRFEIYDAKKKIQDIKLSKVKNDNLSLPIKSFISTSTTHLAYVTYLGQGEKLLGFPSPNLISDSILHQRFTKGKIQDLGSFGAVNLEKLIELQPDLYLDYYGPSNQSQIDKISKGGIDYLFINEFYEASPLAKSEWIKLFGVLFDKQKKADSIFDLIESRYLEIESKIKSNSKRPEIISGVMYGDSWHAPASNSFTADMFKKAGGKYAWGDLKGTGSLKLSFEYVFSNGVDADYWIGVGGVKSLSQLVNENSKYKLFKAFKTKNIYSTFSSEKTWGANPIFEEGVLRPDLILEDFYNIINKNDVELNYYGKLD